MIFIIDDDVLMSEVLGRIVVGETQIFTDGFAAVSALQNGLPDVIILDLILNGPTGFSVLNELQSYSDTGKIPVIIVSSVNVDKDSLAEYGVVAVFNKATMFPEDLKAEVKKWTTKV